MAFCTRCGAKLDDNARFCAGCGTPMAAPVSSVGGLSTSAPGASAAAAVYPAAQVAAAPAAPAKSSGALKVILVIAGVLLLLVVVAFAGLIYVGYRAKKALNLSVTSSNNAAEVAANLGIESYPGAKVLKGSGGAVSIGGISVGGAEFETSDPVEKVAEFYRSRYPNSTLSAADDNGQSIVVAMDKSFVTIAIKERAGATRITISRMAGSPPPR
jgi:hypothetical protein